MLRKAKESEKEILVKYITNDLYQNLYLYIDLLTYGLNGDDIETWIYLENEKIELIIYRYHDSFQLFKTSKKNIDYYEIYNFFYQNKKRMISGEKNVIKCLSRYLNDYHSTFGYVLEQYKKNVITKNIKVEQARFSDLDDIAKLICSNDEIGGHYEINALSKQLNERMELYNCRNFIIKEKDRIIAHYGTYADYQTFAIMGGLIVHNEFRNKKLGSYIHSKISTLLINESKHAILYCYNDKLLNFYSKLGAIVKYECGKLELNL